MKSQSKFNTINVTEKQVYELTNLREHTPYIIHVLAVTGAGQGPHVERKATTLRVPQVTGKPSREMIT